MATAEVSDSEKKSRFKNEPTKVELKPPVECNWKKGQVVTFNTLKKLFFGKQFHYYLPEKGKLRITNITADSSGRSFTIQAKVVGDKTKEYSWVQFWWERGDKDNRKEGFYYCGISHNQPESTPVSKKPARKKKKTSRKK
tara:strand:- start:190 stop:609 length:420 start_codon:yes stop_codon:yes gene_type:complete